MGPPLLVAVRRDFASIQDAPEAIYLYGSHLRHVDVCVVAGPSRDPEAVLSGVFGDMPDWLRGQVMDGGILVWARNEPALSEYLRPSWKVWDGRRHRNVPTDDDVRRTLDAQRQSSSA